MFNSLERDILIILGIFLLLTVGFLALAKYGPKTKIICYTSPSERVVKRGDKVCGQLFIGGGQDWIDSVCSPSMLELCE